MVPTPWRWLCSLRGELPYLRERLHGNLPVIAIDAVLAATMRPKADGGLGYTSTPLFFVKRAAHLRGAGTTVPGKGESVGF